MNRVIIRDCLPLRRQEIERRLGGASHAIPLVELASEKPRVQWCDNRCKEVAEVLRMDGYVPRRDTIPLIDKDRSSIRNVLGSIRHIKVDGGRLVGRLYWASCKRSQAARTKWDEGHLSHVECEAEPLQIIEYQSSKFKGIDGAVDEVTRWTAIAVMIR